VPQSALDELRDAYRRSKKREPKLADLLAFDLPFDAELFHAYRDHVRALEYGYDELRRRAEEEVTLKPLTEAVDAFWKFAVEQRDALKLFQLMRWWRTDHIGRGGRSSIPSSPVEDVAYLHLVVALLVHALGGKSYPANVRVKSFTQEEWAFVRAPLRGRYLSSYETMLTRVSHDVPKFVRDTELFLRLHAFGLRRGALLATNEEIQYVLTDMLSATPADLNARSLSTADMEKRPRKTEFKIGETVGNSVYIAFFEAKPARQGQVYVNFAHTGGVLYVVPRVRLVTFADQAEYELIYELTKGLLVLLPLLFDVMMMVPGVVAGGLPGLVEALLQPVEAKAAEQVMEAMGLDPDKAGWVVLGINILAHRLSAKEPVEAPVVEAEESGLSNRGLKNRATDETGTRTPAPESTIESAGARPRIAANENAGVNLGKAAAANENRLTGPTLAELEKHGATAEQAEKIAMEIAELDRIEQELAEETEEELGRAAASAGGRRPGVGSRGTTLRSRGAASNGVKGSARTTPVRGPRAPRPTGPTVLDEALCTRKGVSARMKKWLEDVSAEWREQTARFRNEPGTASYRGKRAHLATQRAVTKKHAGTISEEMTGVSSSRSQRMADLKHLEGPVAELKPWAWQLPDGGLATSRAAITEEIETLQIQAYEVVDRELGQPVFVFAGNGDVWTPDPGVPSGWIKIGGPR
jgi:hypothetical protein